MEFDEVVVERRRVRKFKEGREARASGATQLKDLRGQSFDVVVCLVSLMDIKRYKAAISEVAGVLKKKGKFVFSITHPCFEFGGTTAVGEPIAEWKYGEGTEGTAERNALPLEVKKYFGIAKVEVSWDMKRLVEPFKTTAFHRTLTEYFRALNNSGFLVARPVEPKPAPKGTAKYPSLRKHMKIPHSVVIEASTE